MDFDLLASRFEVRSEVRSSRFGSIEGSKKLGSVRSEVRLRGGSSAPTEMTFLNFMILSKKLRENRQSQNSWICDNKNEF